MDSTANTQAAFLEFLRLESPSGSGKASSYIRALELLGNILARKAPKQFPTGNLWAVRSPAYIQDLYDFVLLNRGLGDAGVFAGESPVSYWRDGFMSAALKSYGEFLVVANHTDKLWKLVQASKANPIELSKDLQEQEIDDIDTILPLDLPTSWEGQEVVRETTARVNQQFFRRLILENYHQTCCLTGIAIPDLLVASHIVPWSEDTANRLNPCNGLCLNALHDKAFDRGLIAFDDGLRLLLSPRLAEHYDNDTISAEFAKIEGKKLAEPERFPPDPGFLAKHRTMWKF